MKNESSFFSICRSTGIRCIYIIILGIGIFGCSDTKSNNSTNKIIESKIAIKKIYENKKSELDKNEIESLEHYKNISLESNTVFLKELSSKIIPKWEKNINILKELNTLDGLPLERLEQNKRRLTYSELRLEAFLLIKKAVSEDTDKYNSQINELSIKIDELNK